jgi:hypothetical protein
MNASLIEAWLEHCKAAKHITQAEAFDQGKRPNVKKYATYTTSLSGQRIYCGLPHCDWTKDVREVGKP